MFFRTSALLTLNIRPIFVLDGEAPELKRAEMINRRKAEFDSKHQTQDITHQTQQDTANEKGISNMSIILTSISLTEN